MRRIYSICGFILVTCAMARRDYTIELENITPVITGIPFLKSLNFSLTNQKAANMDAMFNVKVNKLPVIASVFLLTKGKRRLNVFQMSVDICEALNNTAPNKFLSVFKDEMLRTSNIPKHCPLQENVLYSVRNYTVNDESYPPILPDATWQFEININNSNNKNLKTGIVKITGHIRRI